VPTERPEVSRLVECDKFVLDRWDFDGPISAGGDGRSHVIMALNGVVRIEGDRAATALSAGHTSLLPASLGSVKLTPDERCVLLDAFLP
jgi:mannose-6-phosphate isomerase